MNRNNVNIAVIGAGLGGLSTALHLQAKGYSVSLFEANEHIGGRANRIAQNGFTFDTGPSLLNYPWVFDRLFAAAGASFSESVPLLPVDPSITFFWRDEKRLTLSSTFSAFLGELERFEPGVGPNLIRFFEASSEQYRIAFDHLVTKNADTPMQWIRGTRFSDLKKLSIIRSFDGELKKYFSSRYVREALGSYAMYLGGSPFDLPGIFSILPYGELAYGLWLPKGGMYSLIESIGSLVRGMGTSIHCTTPVQRIVVENGKCKGIVTGKNDTFRPFDAVVSNVDVPTTESSLLHDVPVRKRSTPPMTCGVVTFYWGIRKKIAGLPHHSIFLPDHYEKTFNHLTKSGKFPVDIPFYISIASKTDPSLAPEGHDTMFVLVPAPLLSQTSGIDWRSTVVSLKQQVLDRLAFHGVALSDSDITFEEVWTPQEWSNRFGLYDGSAFGAIHTLRNIGPFRKKNADPDIAGLYYVGASTVPGTGMPMVALGGAMTAERVAEYVR